MRILLVLLLYIFFAEDVSCQKYISTTEVIKINRICGSTFGHIRTMLPKSVLNRQEVLSTKFVPEADTVYLEHGVLFASWDIANFNTGDSITITANLKIERADLRSARKISEDKYNRVELQKYLKNEFYIRKDNKKIRLKAISLKGKDDIETSRNIYEFVIAHMDYYNFKNESRGAKKAFREKRGDCTEYSEVMISLCRANDIPARIVQGKVIRTSNKVGLHNWVEVYFEDYGWVPFDPTFADNPISLTDFEKMRNVYIYYSNLSHTFQTSSNIFGYGTCGLGYKVIRSWEDLLKPAFNEAIEYYKKMDNEKAVPILDSLIAMTPLDYRLHVYQGVAHARLNKFDKGLKYLQAAMRLAYFDREKKSVFYSFANYFALKGDIDRAFSYLEEALLEIGEIDPLYFENDEDLKSLREYPRFSELLKKLK